MDTLFTLDSDPVEKPTQVARQVIDAYNRAFMIGFYQTRLAQATNDIDKQHYTERLKSWQINHPIKTN